jgi:hypothetical protein
MILLSFGELPGYLELTDGNLTLQPRPGLDLQQLAVSFEVCSDNACSLKEAIYF